jgi:drug/metabolite transporter (DMT)-like permease
MSSQLPPSRTGLGVAAALGAGLVWGLVFVVPLLLPGYPPTLLTFGRYLAFGLVTLPIAAVVRRALAGLDRADWWEAAKLSLVGNFAYYLALSAAIQWAGAPLPTLIIGMLPVVIAVTANLGRKAFAWPRLALPLALILAGLACVNADQWARLEEAADVRRYLGGAVFAGLAVAAWTWYPLRNARWMQAHPDRSATVWATAQGVVTLPIAALGFLLSVLWLRAVGASGFEDRPLLAPGDAPQRFWGLMFVVGLSASWLGTLLWNVASKHTPTALTGQLIVFETLAALAYAYLIDARWPSVLEAAGIALLIAGVLIAVRRLAAPRI